MKKTYVKVIKGNNNPPHPHSSWWYNNRVGEIFRVDPNIFPPDYTVIGKPNKRGLHPMLHANNVEIVHPGWWKRFLIRFK